MKIKDEEQLQKLALTAQTRQAELMQKEEELQKAMESLPQYREMKKIQKEIEKIDDLIKNEGLKLLKELGLKTSEGPAGKITLCQRRSYKIVDANELPKEYKNLPLYEKEIKKMNADIKKSFELLNKPVSGIQQNITEYVMITPKKLEELDD